MVFISHLRFYQFYDYKKSLTENYPYLESSSSTHYIINFDMLKFNPEHQLTLAPTPDNKLQTTLSISNPSTRHAPFKVKSTRPSLFVIEPATGILLSNQTIRVMITTRQQNTPELAHQISYHNKFKIQFALVEKVPASVQDGIKQINEDNKQQHRLFLASVGRGEADIQDARSGISNRYTYRTVDNEDLKVNFGKNYPSHIQTYQTMNSDQKFEYLKLEIAKLDKEKQQLMVTSKPKQIPNLLKIILIIIVCLLLGNFLGKSMGLGARQVKKQPQKKWYHFGFQRFWSQHPQEKDSGSWWQFWK